MEFTIKQLVTCDPPGREEGQVVDRDVIPTMWKSFCGPVGPQNSSRTSQPHSGAGAPAEHDIGFAFKERLAFRLNIHPVRPLSVIFIGTQSGKCNIVVPPITSHLRFCYTADLPGRLRRWWAFA